MAMIEIYFAYAHLDYALLNHKLVIQFECLSEVNRDLLPYLS